MYIYIYGWLHGHIVCCTCAEKMLLYDDVDEEVLRCYHEMSLANLIYFALKEGACSEQSSRMTAMDSASKNAGKQTCMYIAWWCEARYKCQLKEVEPECSP